MSASKHKKQRKEQFPNGDLAKLEKEQSAQKEVKKYNRLAIITVAVLIVVGLVAGFFSSSIPSNTFTAVTVGDHQLSAAEFSYFYSDAYYNYYSTYSDYIYYIMDPDSPLDSQIYDEATGETWADYFVSQAMITAASTYELYDAAVAAGFTLSEEQQSELDYNITSIESMAMMYGLASGDAYLAQSYGRGTTMESYGEYLTIGTTASYFAQSQYDSFTYDQAALDATYAANPNNFDQVDYKIYYVSVESGEYNEDGTIIADMEASLAQAEEMAAASYQNIEEFDNYALALAGDNNTTLYSDPSYTLRSNTPISETNSALTEWLSDDTRVYGDTTVVLASDIAYYVGFYIGRPDITQPLPNVRDIYVTAYADETDTEDPTGMIAAQATIDTIIAEYESGTDFTSLVELYSQDYTTSTNGGLYENYVPGTLSTIDETWLFDTARQAGDMTAIESTAGIYLFLYDSQGTPYVDYLTDLTLRDADYNAWYTANSTNYVGTTSDLGLFFLDK